MLLVGTLAYYFAVVSNVSLVYLLLLSYGAIVQFFPLLLVALFWRRSTLGGVLSGLLVGCAITLIWNIFPHLQWQQIHPGVWGLVGNVIVLVVVSLATRPMNQRHVREFTDS